MTHATGLGPATRASHHPSTLGVAGSIQSPTMARAMARARGARAAATASTLYRCLIVLLTLVSLPRHADGGVHSVMPSSGAVSGSTTAVAVIGSDFFQTPATTCKFGSVSVPGDVTDASTIACLPPASVGGAGFVRVEVSMNAQDFTSGGDVYYQLSLIHI